MSGISGVVRGGGRDLPRPEDVLDAISRVQALPGVACEERRLAKGNVAMDMNIVLGSAKEAKSFVDEMLSTLASVKGAIPPQFQKLVESLKINAASDAANMKLNATEKDVMALVSLAMSKL